MHDSPKPIRQTRRQPADRARLHPGDVPHSLRRAAGNTTVPARFDQLIPPTQERFGYRVGFLFQGFISELR